jgi:hypothetical protein
VGSRRDFSELPLPSLILFGDCARSDVVASEVAGIQQPKYWNPCAFPTIEQQPYLPPARRTIEKLRQDAAIEVFLPADCGKFSRTFHASCGYFLNKFIRLANTAAKIP